MFKIMNILKEIDPNKIIALAACGGVIWQGISMQNQVKWMQKQTNLIQEQTKSMQEQNVTLSKQFLPAPVVHFDTNECKIKLVNEGGGPLHVLSMSFTLKDDEKVKHTSIKEFFPNNSKEKYNALYFTERKSGNYITTLGKEKEKSLLWLKDNEKPNNEELDILKGLKIEMKYKDIFEKEHLFFDQYTGE